jgi:DNA polymerase-3 subunit gamma/tau
MTAQSLFGDSDSHERASFRSEDAIGLTSSADTRSASTSSLYRKYRPQSFDEEELVGQEHVVRTLCNAIALDRVAHAYLFSGPRGTGKTTTARVLAKAINCQQENARQRPCNVCANCRAINAGATPDLVEIDAASNRGIDDIRDLRERVRYAPTQLFSKVYIIDEAHQITGAAANAFLKTLEEPPSHTRFILATTDPEELLPTIVSRCQRFEFRRVSADAMTRRLQTVAELESISIEADALRMIARHATGSLRDALGLLEQLSLLSAPGSTDSAGNRVTASDVTKALGLSRNDRVESLVEAISQHDAGEALRVVQDAIDDGEDARQLNRQLLSYLRLLLFVRSGGGGEADDRARELAGAFSLTELAALAKRFGEIDFSIKHAPFPQLPLEIAIVESTVAPGAAEPGEVPSQARSNDDNMPEAVSPRSTRPTSLRDRVRAPSGIREVPVQTGPAPSTGEPTPITPLRTVTSLEPVTKVEPGSGPMVDVEQIAELWPNVRADVKALNRRIEALLSEVDPVAISGNQITLAVPYPFHRDKLNTDEVRDTVGGVLSRLLGRQISLVCILRGEMSARPTAGPERQEQTESLPRPENEPEPEEEERARVRLRAAMNIFDAEEIQDIEPARQPIPSPDV